jgi:AcrR family transcriptional regulator
VTASTASLDGRVARGERTRQAVLDAAVRLASVEGLDGLSLGRLADSLGVSKSGLFAHWPSKESLQLATIEHARTDIVERVVRPALRHPRGIRRLWAMHDLRIAYYVEDVLPGGCFFCTVEFELDSRPGPLRDRVADATAEWLALLQRLATEAVAAGELHAGASPEQLAFEIDALGVAAVYQSRLFDRAEVYHRARIAVLDRLRALSTDPSLLAEEHA